MFDLGKLRSNSTVFIIAPRNSGKTQLINELISQRTGPYVLCDGTVQQLDQCIALLEAPLEGKTVLIDHLPLNVLPKNRCASLRAALHKELELDLLITVRRACELSQLELRNSDYLIMREPDRNDLRRVSRVCGHSMKKLARALPEESGWLVIDRRDNRMYQYLMEIQHPIAEVKPVEEPASIDEPIKVQAQAVDEPSKVQAQAVEEPKVEEAGVWSYLTSWFW